MLKLLNSYDVYYIVNKLPVLIVLLVFACLAIKADAEETTFSGRYEYRTDQESLKIV